MKFLTTSKRWMFDAAEEFDWRDFTVNEVCRMSDVWPPLLTTMNEDPPQRRRIIESCGGDMLSNLLLKDYRSGG
ncbi:MAG: hypothetical protein ACTS68_01350 [Candidatus Hodgkinia cicadicola]